MFKSKTALAGFAAGLGGTLMAALVVGVLIGGGGLSDRTAPSAELVYPNL